MSGQKGIDAFLSCFPERSYRVATARLDELGVVLARLVDFDWFLLRAPQSTDHDGPVGVGTRFASVYERYEARLGRTVRALVDRVDDEQVQARTVWQADDIDGVTSIAGAADVPAGSFVDVRLDAVVDDVDFAASFERVVSAPTEPAKRARVLPVMGSIGSYGR